MQPDRPPSSQENTQRRQEGSERQEEGRALRVRREVVDIVPVAMGRAYREASVPCHQISGSSARPAPSGSLAAPERRHEKAADEATTELGNIIILL